MTYALLFNTAAQTLSMSDDRMQHECDGPRDHASMMLEFEQMPTASTQMRQMWGEFIRPFALGPDAAAAAQESYYRFAVDTVIAGLTATGLEAVEPK